MRMAVLRHVKSTDIRPICTSRRARRLEGDGMSLVELKCLHCGALKTAVGTHHLDDLIACLPCGSRFEFCQMHEAACVSHGEELPRALPGLASALGAISMVRSLRIRENAIEDEQRSKLRRA